MELFVVTFGIMVVAVCGMAVGVLFGRTPIAGSCGGLNAMNGSSACQSCSRPCASRRRRHLDNTQLSKQSNQQMESVDAQSNQSQ